MTDLEFDITTRELVVENGDFKHTSKPSVQYGGIIRDSRCAFLRTPTIGVGIQEIINSPISEVNYEMNRWKQMCIADGAKVADFTLSNNNTSESAIQINMIIDYV